MPNSNEKNFDEIWIEMTSVLEKDDSGRFSNLPTADELRSKSEELKSQSGEHSAPKFEKVFQEAWRDKMKKEAPAENLEPVSMTEMQTFYEEKVQKKNPGSRIRHIDEVWDQEMNSLDEEILASTRTDVTDRRHNAFSAGNRAGLEQAVKNYDPEFAKDYQDLNMGTLGSLLRGASDNDRYAISEQALHRINEAGAKAVFMGDPESEKMGEVFKHSAYRIDASPFYQADRKLFGAKNVQSAAEPYREEEIKLYMDNLRQFGKNGALETAISKTKLSDEFNPVAQQFKNLQEDFMKWREPKTGMHGDIPENSSLPCFSEESLDRLGKSCGEYLKKSGYKNNSENKLVRDIEKSVFQSRLIRAKSAEIGRDEERVGVESNQLLDERLKYLSERLNAVGTHRFGRNSPEFTNMKNTLDRLAKNGVRTADDMKELQTAAQYYMDKKGAASRSTDKGQIRYDIAKELTDIAHTFNEKQPTKEELQEMKDKVEKKPEKVSFKDLEQEERSSRPAMSEKDQKEYSKAMANIYEKDMKDRVQKANQEIKAPGKRK